MYKKTQSLTTLALSLILALAMTSPLPTKAYAQAAAPTAPAAFEEKAELSGTRKQLATIVFAGLAGAILGLSTLSFYGRPQDHLSNIAIGFALGVIGGASFTTYKAATQPYGAYDMSQETFKKELFGEPHFIAGEIRAGANWRWEF